MDAIHYITCGAISLLLSNCMTVYFVNQLIVLEASCSTGPVYLCFLELCLFVETSKSCSRVYVSNLKECLCALLRKDISVTRIL